MVKKSDFQKKLEQISSFDSRLDKSECDKTQKLLLKLFVEKKTASFKDYNFFKTYFFSNIYNGNLNWTRADLVSETVALVLKANPVEKFLESEWLNDISELSSYKVTKLANYISKSIKNRKNNALIKLTWKSVLFMWDLNKNQSSQEGMELDDISKESNWIPKDLIELTPGLINYIKRQVFTVDHNKRFNFNQTDQERAINHLDNVVDYIRTWDDDYIRDKRGVNILCSWKWHRSRKILRKALVKTWNDDVIDRFYFKNCKETKELEWLKEN